MRFKTDENVPREVADYGDAAIQAGESLFTHADTFGPQVNENEEAGLRKAR